MCRGAVRVPPALGFSGLGGRVYPLPPGGGRRRWNFLPMASVVQDSASTTTARSTSPAASGRAQHRREQGCTSRPREQGLEMACLEEIALRLGFITREEYPALADGQRKRRYGQYLMRLLEEGLV